MRVQHNIMAMNSYRNYSNNVKSLSGNLEKLSSGYKINRAGDDAAGLAISEKMRAQITGLNAAQKNVKDGISLVKTAEGAMQEIQDMLNRMDYLATQSANGTYQNEVDRENLQKEVDALKTEINRIADSSNFNGIKLLDGSLSGSGSSGGASVSGLKDISKTLDTNGNDAAVAGKEAQAGKWVIDLSDITFTSETAESELSISVGGVEIGTFTIAGTSDDDAKPTTALKDADFTPAANQVLIGGASVNVSFEDGKIILEMDKTPTTTANTTATGGTGYVGDLTVTFAATTGTGASITSNISQGDAIGDAGAGIKQIPQAKQEAEQRVAGADRLLANTKFTLGSDVKLEDGTMLKIGNETYTFAVGSDSKFKDADNVIDLTDISTDDLQDKIDDGTVGLRLSEAAKDNSQWDVTTTGADGVIYLKEKEGSGLSYVGSSIVGDVSRDTAGALKDDADWKGVVQYGKGTVSTSSGGGLMLQIGDTADSFNQMSVKVGDMHVKALGIADVDISNQAGAAAAIAKIKDAINNVSSVRGDLGAIQNRLDHTANNLSVMAENIQDAESTIRDTDVAEEMMSYVKNNILVQSAQAMLAQANQVPQGVLQLLG